jgi:ArsR family transcriptional regulator, arsenate/arsenite/antimonite-responsive transcriptional repressor
MEASHTVLALSALAHEARLAVFRLLVQAGTEGVAAGVIATRLEIAPSALSFHLKGLLVQRPDGRKIHYSANFAAMVELIAYLTDNCCQGATCAVSADAVCTTC